MAKGWLVTGPGRWGADLSTGGAFSLTRSFPARWIQTFATEHEARYAATVIYSGLGIGDALEVHPYEIVERKR